MHTSHAPRRIPASRPFALLVAALAILAACGAEERPLATTPLPSLPGDTLLQPRVVRSTNGVLNVTLQATMATLMVPTSATTAAPQTLRSYQLVAVDGVPVNAAPAFPGPTFDVAAGDSIHIVYVNNLPPSSQDECMDYPAANAGVDVAPNCFHGPNYSNIHYHGFHVSPNSPADNVLLQIAPGDTFTYAFRLPANQSPGTHWYHPHKHGSVALQVTNGMSGAFIIRGGGLDSLTAAMGIREYLIAIQKVDSQLNLVDAGLSAATLVNGQQTPVVLMRPNEVQRWRIVNENITATANFEIGFVDVGGVDEPSVYEIARDGVQYAPVNYDPSSPDTTVLMAPGNRLDVFVQAPATPGLHRMRAASRVAEGTGAQAGRRLQAGAAAPSDTLFYVYVVNDGTPVTTQLPATLPALPSFLANLPGTLDPSQIDPDSTPVVIFTDRGGPGQRSNPPQFFIGNSADTLQKFDPVTVYVPTTASGDSLPMILGGLQTWRVVNTGKTTNHPFHIHINPFQVIQVVYPRGSADPNAALYANLNAAVARGAPIWLDVVPLPLPSTTDPVGSPGYVIIRQEYNNYSGQFVMHCHILGHEERGMMQILEIFGPGGARAQRTDGHAHPAGHVHAAGEAHPPGQGH